MATSNVSGVVNSEMGDSEKNPRQPTSPKSSVRSASRASTDSKRSSSYRSVLEAAARARASAEAAATKVAYAKKQLEIKRQRARLDIDLEELEIEKEAEAARVKAEVLEAAAAIEKEDVLSVRSHVPAHMIQRRTEDYVQSQSQLDVQSLVAYSGVWQRENDPTQRPPPAAAEEMHSQNIFRPTEKAEQEQFQEGISTQYYGFPSHGAVRQHEYSLLRQPAATATTPPVDDFKPPPDIFRSFQRDTGSPAQPPGAEKHTPAPKPLNSPHIQQSQYSPPHANTPHMIDFAKFLARRELVTTSLTKYDDTPENFRAWQSSFLNATQGLDLSFTEELDLLVKWLGKDSSEHVKRIRAVHVTNPKAALQLSWDRLHECFGTPEIVENALFNRLDNFPRLSARDNTKLRLLSDLLMELLAAKDDGYLPGLAYLDTPRGIKPIVEKLPPGLQEKWLSVGSKYKEHHRTTFPPFSFFVDFVYGQAKARNDPNFSLSISSQPYSKGEKTPFRPSEFRTALSVHKTDVSATTDANTSSSIDTERNSDPARYCPVHKKAHPLEKCRSFRAKTFQERIDILKEQKRCFKCCAPNHLAKDCQTPLKCGECDSERHCSAMHPDTSLPPQPSSPPQTDTVAQGGLPLEVTSRCTKVCGKGNLPRSCSKVCLVRVFPQGQPKRSIKMYVIIDDQSNRSLARSEFFHLFKVESSLSPYLMKTCAGTTEMTGRKAVGFQIEAVDGGVCLDLPPLIECNEIMNNKSEIPTPEVALAHTHLKHIAPHIPELDPDAEMMILLGRDMIRAHKVRDQVNGPHDAPFAQRLDLGWVIIGEVCLDNAQKPTLSVFKTHVLQNGRPSLLTPCHNSISVKEKPCYGGEHRYGHTTHSLKPLPAEDQLGQTVSQQTDSDNKCAMSFEDELFLKTMEKEVQQDEKNNWVAPLPFKSPRPRLPPERLNTSPPFSYVGLDVFGPWTVVTRHTRVSSDPSAPVLLSPSMLLTQKPGLLAPPGDFTGKDLLKGQWRQVQTLANEFWNRWRNEYLSTLHPRRKWHRTHRSLQPGDIVLLKQTQVPRNEWPMAVVSSTSKSSDGKVRKVEVKTSSEGVSKTYLRPISDVVLLLEKTE